MRTGGGRCLCLPRRHPLATISIHTVLVMVAVGHRWRGVRGSDGAALLSARAPSAARRHCSRPAVSLTLTPPWCVVCSAHMALSAYGPSLPAQHTFRGTSRRVEKRVLLSPARGSMAATTAARSSAARRGTRYPVGLAAASMAPHGRCGLRGALTYMCCSTMAAGATVACSSTGCASGGGCYARA